MLRLTSTLAHGASLREVTLHWRFHYEEGRSDPYVCSRRCSRILCWRLRLRLQACLRTGTLRSYLQVLPQGLLPWPDVHHQLRLAPCLPEALRSGLQARLRTRLPLIS